MRLSKIIHNLREYQNYQGEVCQEFTIDVLTASVDVDKIYGNQYLCYVDSDVEISSDKEPSRIPITIQLPPNIFTIKRATRIKRNYIVGGGAGVFASLDLLKPFLTTKEIKTLNDAILDAVKQYKNSLPDKPDPVALRKQEKQARIIAKLQSGVDETVLDTLALDVGGV